MPIKLTLALIPALCAFRLSCIKLCTHSYTSSTHTHAWYPISKYVGASSQIIHYPLLGNIHLLLQNNHILWEHPHNMHTYTSFWLLLHINRVPWSQRFSLVPVTLVKILLLISHNNPLFVKVLLLALTSHIKSSLEQIALPIQITVLILVQIQYRVLTPAILLNFEYACKDFFSNAKGGINDDSKVIHILPGFKDPIIRGWISSNCAHLSSLKFENFIKLLPSKFLSKQWKDELLSKILWDHLRPGQDFLTWSTKLQRQNCILWNTESQFDEKHLREQISMAVDIDLRIAAHDAEVNKAKSLWEFLDIYTLCDEKHCAAEMRTCSIIDDSYCKNRSLNKENAYHPYKKEGCSTTSSGQPSSNAATRPPKLTVLEIEIIESCSGCFKCWKIFQLKEHITTEALKKTCKFPSGENYCSLTWEYANKIKALWDARKGSSTTKPIASTSAMPATLSTSTSSIVELNTLDNSNFVASMYGPLATSAVIGNESVSSEGDVSVCQPFKAKHYIWKCTIDGLTDDFPVKISALIDNGTHMVFIRPETVKQLGLPTFPLPNPEKVDVAISSAQSTRKTLSHFVKFKATSLDGLWTSHTVIAIVAPGLCMPIIFGLPFLEFNNIICDHALCTCIHRKTGYNSLHPVIPDPPPRPRPKLKERLKSYKCFKAESMKELISTSDTKWGTRLQPHENVKPFDKLKAVKNEICTVIKNEVYIRREKHLMDWFKMVFEPIPHYDELPKDILAEIRLIDPGKTIKSHNYPCPCKYKEAWHTLIQQHLKNGVIQHSSSSFASPAFIIPKADPNVLPHWVDNFWQLNENTVTDSHPLPHIDDISNDCTKGKIWAKLDMTNSFFQTRMHPDNIPYTTVSTPFGLYEWLVMLMGLKNAPAIHQRWVTKALGALIGKICHIYLDNIIIWSNSLKEHNKNVALVLQALADAQLYCNPKKTYLYCEEINFLGYNISQRGIEADTSKMEHVLNWPIPKSATHVRQFLGLVRYISMFLPKIAEYTVVLNKLTHKNCEKKFPAWMDRHQRAFDAIKNTVVSHEYLTTINLEKMPNHQIFVSTDASDVCSGAVLSFGKIWESSQPVAFDSMTFKGAELNYPVHEKELLAIIRALKEWWTDLICVPFTIFTDHKMLENFHAQWDLSCHQARWIKFLSQYDRKIVYIKGEDNSVADALSRILIDAVHISNSSMEAETHATPVFHHASYNRKIASILTCKDVRILGDLCLALIASISERVNKEPLIVLRTLHSPTCSMQTPSCLCGVRME